MRTLLAAAILALVPVHADATPAFDLDRVGVHIGQATSSTRRTLGYEIEMNQTVTVTHLGVLDADADGPLSPPLPPGITNEHRVAIWDITGSLIVEAIVPAGTAGVAVDFFMYTPIAPVVLNAGERYVLGSRTHDANPILNPTDGYIYAFPGRTTPSPAVTWIEERQTSNFAWGFPANDVAGFEPEFGYFGPNFLYVPEPGTALLLLLGLTGLASSRRT